MGLDIGAILGPIGGIVSSIITNNAEKRRRRRVSEMLERIMAQQRHDFSAAKGALNSGRVNYMANPDRMALINRYRQQAESPGPFTPGVVSTMKAQSADSGARDAALGMSQLRERMGAAGIGNSGMAQAAYESLRSNTRNEVGARFNEIDIGTKKAQEDYKRSALDSYQKMIMDDQGTQYGFEKDLAGLYGSKQYGNSALFSAL